MYKSLIGAVVIKGALLFSVVGASAIEATWDVLEHFGLKGVWSVQCETPANPKASRMIFAKGPEGLAIREIEYGAGYPILRTIVEDAQLISPLKLKIRVRNVDPNWGKYYNMVHEAVLIKEDDPRTHETIRHRAIESVLSDGTVLVKNGILLSIGKPSYWEYKCRNAMS